MADEQGSWRSERPDAAGVPVGAARPLGPLGRLHAGPLDMTMNTTTDLHAR